MVTNRKAVSLIIDWILPIVIIGFSLWGLYVSVFEVGAGWLGCHTERTNYAAIHIVLSITAILSIITLILFLWTLPANHDVPPLADDASAQTWFNQYPHECFFENGTLAKCTRGSCAGRIKPPRAHHCSVCQTCRMEWDHHCPWVGSCLTVQQSKAFLVLLFITSLGIWFMTFPIIRPTLDGAYSMYLVSRTDSKCSRLWWNWWGSYIVFGGPGGRWVLGTALGYWVAELEEPPNPQRCRFGLLFMGPSFRAAITIVTALSLAGFCLVLALQMMFRLLRGQTTIEALQGQTRTKGSEPPRYLWIPKEMFPPSTSLAAIYTATQLNASTESLRRRVQQPLQEPESLSGIAFPIHWGERIYDLGIWKNVGRFWAVPVLGLKREPSALVEPPIISSELIERALGDYKDD